MSITESRIKAIEDRLDELTKNFLQTQKNQVPITQKTDNIANELVELDDKTQELQPYIATQNASYGDMEVVFEDVPQGIISVNIVDSEGESISPFYKREGNDVIVGFAPLDYAADVTISIQ